MVMALRFVCVRLDGAPRGSSDNNMEMKQGYICLVCRSSHARQPQPHPYVPPFCCYSHFYFLLHFSFSLSLCVPSHYYYFFIFKKNLFWLVNLLSFLVSPPFLSLFLLLLLHGHHCRLIGYCHGFKVFFFLNNLYFLFNFVLIDFFFGQLLRVDNRFTFL